MDNNNYSGLLLALCGFLGYLLVTSNNQLDTARETIKQQQVIIDTTNSTINKLRGF